MKDLLLNSDGSFQIKNGDFVIGDSDNQNVNDILQAVKGDYKLSPQIGLNSPVFINSNSTNADIKLQAKLQLELDGFRVKDIVVTKDSLGQLNIEPYVTR
jgi:hypothetical protein